MSMIALRIPNDMKKEMDRVKINWAEYLRHSIEEVIDSKKKRAMISRFIKWTQRNKATEPGTAVSLIRQMRDRG